jgi:hypothetical protein
VTIEESIINTPGDSMSGESRAVIWMAAAVGLSALGMAYHTIMEFGYSGLWSPATGMIPVVGIQILLFAAWWLVPGARRLAGIALVVTGVFQLVGGAIISVLPLPFPPFLPEQSLSHYLTHLVLGLAQLPLIVIPWRQESLRRAKRKKGETAD